LAWKHASTLGAFELPRSCDDHLVWWNGIKARFTGSVQIEDEERVISHDTFDAPILLTFASSPYVRFILADMTIHNHRIYMTFFQREGWYVQFLEADLKTPLPRTFNFKDPEKIKELAKPAEPQRHGRCLKWLSKPVGADAT
jgi:hypothetical protein